MSFNSIPATNNEKKILLRYALSELHDDIESCMYTAESEKERIDREIKGTSTEQEIEGRKKYGPKLADGTPDWRAMFMHNVEIHEVQLRRFSNVLYDVYGLVHECEGGCDDECQVTARLLD